VYQLKNKGRSEAAAEQLSSLPQRSHVGANTMSNASLAMQQLLFRFGGLETVSRVLDSFLGARRNHRVRKGDGRIAR